MVIGERNSKNVSHFRLQFENLYQDTQNLPKPQSLDILGVSDSPDSDKKS